MRKLGVIQTYTVICWIEEHLNQADGFVKNVPTYWGEQPILEGSSHIGISIVFFCNPFIVFKV